MIMHILLIDNEPRWIDFARRDLASFEVVVAQNQEESLTEMEKGQFDLVIVSASWIKVLEVLREKYAEKRVLVTTTRPTPQEALTAYRSGTVDYIAKSFANKQLLAHVQKVVPAA